ncbi:MAG TPA: EAL domain-containing protein, partial [Thermoanaerobaculia bacterium]|nr:EAL domain-containing protein [Thermoanaerobaculia bacterium]
AGAGAPAGSASRPLRVHEPRGGGAGEREARQDAPRPERESEEAGPLLAGGPTPLSLEERLRQALRRDELSLVYRPVVAVATGRYVAFEAEVRWARAERELPPERVLPLAEATGLAVELDDWLLEHALTDLAAWRRGAATRTGAGEVAVAVNLSAASLDDPGMPRRMERALAAAGLGDGALELDVTEMVAMRDALRTSRAMDAVRSHGARMALDDFGTAYSSLLYLRTFPLDLLKIDPTFARDIVDQPVDQEIAASLVRLVHALGMQVEAVGVESGRQLAALGRHGCDRVQGRHLSPPLAAAECIALLRHGGRHPACADS